MPKKGADAEWINNTFLEKVLTSSQVDGGIKVTSYEIARATAAGDNYASEMYRVSVQYQRNGKQATKSLIVKAEPIKEEMCRVCQISIYFHVTTIIIYHHQVLYFLA